MPKESFFAARRCKKFFLCGRHFDGHFFNAQQIFYSFRAPQTKIRAITHLRQKIPADASSRSPSKSQEPTRARLPKNQSSHKRKNALAKRNKKHKRRLTKIPLKFNCPNSPPQTKIRAITRLRQKFPQTPAPVPPQNRKNRRARAIVIKFARPPKTRAEGGGKKIPLVGF